MIKGISVVLHVNEQTGTDAFNRPTYRHTYEYVKNVLVGEPSTDDIINELNLTGKRLAYTLAIPKGDEHNWLDTYVEFWGYKFRTFGNVTQGIEDNIPGPWNKKVKVELIGISTATYTDDDGDEEIDPK